MDTAQGTQPPDRPVHMRSRYDGVCQDCAEAFSAGASIVWSAHRGAAHYECYRKRALSVMAAGAATTASPALEADNQELRERLRVRGQELKRARHRINTLQRELDEARDLTLIYARAQVAVALARALATACRVADAGTNSTALRGSLLELY